MPQSNPKLGGASFLDALSTAPFSIVLTNPNLDDNPIVYVNQTFTSITGYAEDFAIGKNCRFLQGDERDQDALDKLRDAIKNDREVTVDIKNFRPDGKPFWNRLMISPLKSENNDTLYFLGIQMELEALPGERKTAQDKDMEIALDEIQHRVKNHLAMVVSMIRLQAGGRQQGEEQDFSTLARRIETLQLLYEELADKEDRGDSLEDAAEAENVALGAYLSRVANAVAHLDGRSGVRVNVDADKKKVPFQAATQLGLILSEIMTNALQHAFEGREEGLVEVEAKTLSNGVFRLTVTDDGIGIPEDLDWPSQGNLGGRIISQLTTGLQASLDVTAGAVQGTTVTIDVPEKVVAPITAETIDA